MNCEQVEELLSAYLDSALATEERRSVTLHLQACTACSTMLAEFRRNDALLSQMPPVSPSVDLRERIFSSPEFLELTGTFDDRVAISKEPTVPHRSTRRDTPGRPQLVAIPGGRQTGRATPPPNDLLKVSRPRRKRGAWALRVMQFAIAATVLLTIGLGAFIGRNIWLHQDSSPVVINGITPPAAPQRGPLSAGLRFVFLRDGALWSAPVDGKFQANQLTARGVTVAANWMVSPPLVGRNAGDMLAYIDLQQARVHVIRSDGQRDIAIQQPLLNAGVQPSLVWDTDTGAAILNSLAWSKDGSMLAFVGDPAGKGQMVLFIYSTQTDTVQAIQQGLKGSAFHPVWSPDGIRVAFELTNNSITSILDYNTQNHGLLTITDNINSQGNVGDSVQTLDWSPSTDAPAITWSVGTIGHIHSIWIRRVGVGGSVAPKVLMTGDYVQTIYSRNGHNGVGSWLLVASVAGQAGDIWRIDPTAGAGLISVTSGKQVGYVAWSPDGSFIDYLDAILSGVGAFHVVNSLTGADTQIATGVAYVPSPAWSSDSQQLAYSTGTEAFIANLHTGTHPLALQGSVSTLVWSASSSNQLVVALSDGQPGVYLINTQHNTAIQLDKLNINGQVQWTEVP